MVFSEKHNKEIPVYLPPNYAKVNNIGNKEYWDYENYDWNATAYSDDFEIYKEIGSGKFSHVYLGCNILTKELKTLKVLKKGKGRNDSVKEKKFKREIKVLTELKGGPNILNLEHILLDEPSKVVTLVLKYLKNDLKSVIQILSLKEIKFYTYMVLMALDYSHSKGIMHRDIKPGNITIDRDKKELCVIDWGLAEFYLPYHEFNCRVSTRPMKGPELLLNYGFYDYSLDMWCFGMMLAAMTFKRNFLIHSKDDAEQLIKMTQLFGKGELYDFCSKYDINPTKEVLTGIKE